MKEAPGETNRPIVLLSDFGLGDPFVGAMKGVIMSINPGAVVIDLTHDISPYNILQAAIILKSSYRFFPPETIFVAVVDPTVGSERKKLLAEAGGRFFVGPDNGIFWPALKEAPAERVILLENPEYFLNKVSGTFHGRDVFAPVAAWLSIGTDPAHFGPATKNIVELHIPSPVVSSERVITGQVLFSDRFGNLTTNITEDMLARMAGSAGRGSICISVRKAEIKGLTTHYVQGKGPSALINSWGYLEIYLPMGNAAKELGIEAGEQVQVAFREN